MFGIGIPELMMIMVLALIIVGPQKLPELGRTLGQAVAQFKAHTDELKSVMSLDSVLSPSPAPASHFPVATGTRTYAEAAEHLNALNNNTNESNPEAHASEQISVHKGEN